MTSKVATALLLMTFCLAGMAYAAPTAFKIGAVGTRYFSTGGGYLEITRIDGKSVQTVNASGRRATWIATFIEAVDAPSYQVDIKKAESIWPLEIGKKVQFDISGGAGGTWTNELRVVRAEKIKVSAGEFDTIVVECYQRSIQTDGLGYIGTTTFWYAPQAGFIVRRASEAQQGAVRIPSWELSRIEPPR